MSLKKEISKIKSLILLHYYHAGKYTIIYPPQGLGDILVLALGLEEYKKLHPQEKIAIIVTKKHFANLCQIFHQNIDKIITLPFPLKKFPSYVLNIVEKVYGYNSHFDKFDQALLEAIGIEKTLNSFSLPSIKPSIVAEKMFEAELPKGKTVLITPEATTSLNCLPSDYWLKVADELSANGYVPVFNSGQKYGSYKNILLPLEDTIHFANLAGTVLGLRSGLNDVLGCFSNAFQIIIYPNNWKKGDMPYLNGFDDDPNGKYLEDGSLQRLYPDKKFIEFIYNQNINPVSFLEVGHENI